jgi:rubrerythrin
VVPELAGAAARAEVEPAASRRSASTWTTPMKPVPTTAALGSGTSRTRRMKSVNERPRLRYDSHMKALVRMRCATCGYGISVREPPPICPMCRGETWENERLLSSLAHDLLHLPYRERTRV